MKQKEVLLSPRESQIVRLILDGHTIVSAAAFLKVTESSIHKHMRRICNECAVTNYEELLLLDWFVRLAVNVRAFC